MQSINKSSKNGGTKIIPTQTHRRAVSTPQFTPTSDRCNARRMWATIALPIIAMMSKGRIIQVPTGDAFYDVLHTIPKAACLLNRAHPAALL